MHTRYLHYVMYSKLHKNIDEQCIVTNKAPREQRYPHNRITQLCHNNKVFIGLNFPLFHKPKDKSDDKISTPGLQGTV